MDQVLALKYRPKKFSDLVGQDTISTTLSLALDSKRLSHAYLFSGLRGSGKTSTARIMAKALVCEKGPTSNPCDNCASCNSANNNKHIDIIEMDAASNRGIDDIKDLIEHTKYKPSSARYKVFVIDEVHMLTTQAFNALLKTLEEPPDFVKFILATTDPLKLPATILSRTQHFRFKKIPHKDVVNHLIHILNLENISFENEALEMLTRSGQGSLRDTLTLMDQAIIFSKGNITTISITDMLGMIDPSFMQNIFDTILKQDETKTIINELDNFDTAQVIDEMTIFLKYRMLKKDPKYDIYLFDRFFRILGDAKQLLSINSDPGFVLILTILKLTEAVSIKTIDEVIEDISNRNIQSVNLNIQATKEKDSIKEIDIVKTKNIDEMYKDVISKVYDRSHDLGKCFEISFTLNSYENNRILINSIAKDECRKQLFKHIMFLKGCIRDIYGENTDIDFKKIEAKTINNNQEISQNTIKQTPEKEISSIDDIVSSSMVKKTIELFQPEKPLKIYGLKQTKE